MYYVYANVQNGEIMSRRVNSSNIVGIYTITCSVDSKRYVGRSISIRHRWSEHKCDLRKNKHRNKHLQNAWNKYGAESFVFEIVEVVDKSALPEREVFWCTELKPEYNLMIPDANMDKLTVSDETRTKMSEARMGIPPANKGKRGLQVGWNKGKKMSEDARQKLSESCKGRIPPNKGIPMSEEQKIKLSIAKTGKKISPHKHPMSEAERNRRSVMNLGRHHTEQSRKNMGDSHRGMKVSDDARLKQSEKRRLWWARKHFSQIMEMT